MSLQTEGQNNIPSRGDLTSQKEKNTRENKKALKIFGVIAAAIIALLLIAAVTLIILMISGEKKALGGNKDNVEVISVPEETASVEREETDSDTNVYVYYKDKKYIYNDKVTTILFAGIDKHADEQLGTFYHSRRS